MRMKDKVAVLTGGGTGIGQHTLISYAKEGADVVVAYNSSRAGAEETVAAVKALGRRAIAVQTDVRDPESIKNLIKTSYEEFGKIDVLVNNCVIRYLSKFEEITPEGWRDAMNVNLRSYYLASKEVAPIMIEQGCGTIINISSMHGVRSSQYQRTAYASSKFGIMALTRALATDLGPKNIFVNSLVIGSFPTKAAKATTIGGGASAEEVAKRYAYENGFCPMHRTGELDEIAESLIFLANAEKGFLNGSVVTADGGWTIID